MVTDRGYICPPTHRIPVIDLSHSQARLGNSKNEYNLLVPIVVLVPTTTDQQEQLSEESLFAIWVKRADGKKPEKYESNSLSSLT